MTKSGGKIVFESTPDPMYTGWRSHIKHMHQSAPDSQYSAIVADWAEAWKSYEIPQPLVSDLQFPRWRGEEMSEDRKFAYECAKHALRLVLADFEKAQSSARDALEALKEAKQLQTEAQARVDCQNRKLKLADELLAKATNVVDALAPEPDLSLPGE